MTYFVKAHGWNENGTKNNFQCVFDLNEVNAKNFIDAVEKAGKLSPFRNNKEIIIEDVVLIHDYLDKEREHWQDVREHAAIAAMQGMMKFFGSLSSIDYNREFLAKLAVEQADALVEELKKNEI